MPAAYDPYRDIRRQEAERERARKAAERARKAAEAERKAAHQDARKDEAARINSDLAQRVEQLNSFLIAGLPATAEPNLSELRVFARRHSSTLGILVAHYRNLDGRISLRRHRASGGETSRMRP